jgi:hypothetical protein
MTRLPCIRILFTIHLDSDFRANHGTERTARAIFVTAKDNRAIAFGIVFLRGFDMSVFTCKNAKVAFLAAFEIDGDPAFFQWVVFL